MLACCPPPHGRKGCSQEEPVTRESSSSQGNWLRALRLLSKRNGPSIRTTTQAVPGNLKFTTRLGAGEAVPCWVIQKAVAATRVRHTSCRTPLHLESLPHGWGFISWLMDSHTWQHHLTSGQKAQECFRCVLGLSLILMQVFP